MAPSAAHPGGDAVVSEAARSQRPGAQSRGAGGADMRMESRYRR